ncbi:DUF4249 domain-containing protein [Bacteroides sp.]|uniref:DUF4249 domain-containing protein n=1 Tax=Bacteroides sp. TaxID=29523 RepID=UPI002621E163|nr:DUF4249 domain-containing protein [Bacteroides sp.]
MKNKINIGIWMCLLWVTLSNCVEKFNTHLPESNSDILIVEGNIVSDSIVVFCLSRSFSLNMESFPQDYNQINAEVCVVGSDNSCFDGVYLGNGKYQVAIGTLNKDVSYSLKIDYNGDTYTSEPQRPLETEEIDNVTYEQPEEYGEIQIRASTQSKGSAYYLWSYEEDWEVRAAYKVSSIYDPTIDKIIEYETAPYYLGWCHNESSDIMVGTTELSIDDYLKDKQLYSIDHTNNRVSHYYSTLVKQRKISVGEYEYYQDKVKLNEEMGGLFTPQPSQLPTNISCSNSEKQVIGYVGVNMNVAVYRIFISTNDIQYENPYDCDDVDTHNYSYYELYMMGYAIAVADPPMKWAPRGCTDVRYLGASLEKPDFWPEETN